MSTRALTHRIAKQIASRATTNRGVRAPPLLLLPRVRIALCFLPCLLCHSPSFKLPKPTSTMSRALTLAVLLLAAAAVAPLASAHGVGAESVTGAKEFAGAGSKGASAKEFARAVGADPDPSPASGLPADPAPDARP
ncbi:hypothetical protein SETIT_2G242800v2 [Setaria italica]|uniref:Uncharacterized protein n=1 Tax=Setaria italica TaxID=4555 RepID=K4A403_SETIT|nr:uncharacterized protein LOC101767265 [Setaria italica]RCV12109.1 hypothetical protein SETIT_2G242800v2 [Setaria italica]